MSIIDNILTQESWTSFLIDWGLAFLLLSSIYLGLKFLLRKELGFSRYFEVEKLNNATFINADLTNSLFQGSRERLSIQRAKFNNANLTNVIFDNVDLTGSDFTEAILDNTKFINCVMTDVIIDKSKVKILNPNLN